MPNYNRKRKAIFLIPLIMLFLSSCFPSSETQIEGKIEMTFKIGEVRSFMPFIILVTDDTSYYIWMHDKSIISQGDRTADISVPFVLQNEYLHHATGEILDAGAIPTASSPIAFPENLPTEYKGNPLKVLKLTNLEQREKIKDSDDSELPDE